MIIMKFTINDSFVRDNLTYNVEIREEELFPGHIKFLFYADAIGDSLSFSGYFNPKELKSLFKKCITAIDELYGEKNNEKN